MAAASSSRDAYQLAGRSQGSVSVDASQLSGSSDGTSYMFRIGSFNFGIEQKMLTGKRCRDYMRKAQDIITTCVQDAGLHIMNGCEFGGHRQGLSAAGIHAKDMSLFQGTYAPSVSSNSNYLTAWGFDADTTQFGVRAAAPSRTHMLGSEICEPELVVHTFEKGTGIRLVQGNLHIRTPNGVNVSMTSRKRTVREALQMLESEAPSDSATQPVVLVLLGDCNLPRDLAEEATQPMQPDDPHWRTVWQVHTTTAARSGDLIFVRGANVGIFIGDRDS